MKAPDISLHDVAVVMNRSGIRWAIAGGWAIDLWLGRTTRDHHDVEVVIAREDQRKLPTALGASWQLNCLDPPGDSWRALPTESIEAPAFQLQARGSSGVFDVFLESIEGRTWTFRRDDRVHRPADDLIVLSPEGIPVVRPEIQLLYMAKSSEPKNEHDFDTARRHLDDDAVSWLRAALSRVHPGHPWLHLLRD